MGRQKVEKRKNTSPRRCHEHSKSNILGQADDFFRCSGEKLNIFGLLCSNACRGTGAKMHRTIVSCVFTHVYMHKYMYIQYFFIYTSPCTHTHKSIYLFNMCCQHCYFWNFQGLPPWDPTVKDFEQYECRHLSAVDCW